jgi:hypothetical protein
MHQLAGQPPGLIQAEVAVLNEQRHLRRRPLGQAELALALVADNPQPRQPSVDAEPSDAHHVVVVPQQCRPLAHRVVKDGILAGRGQVLGPAVIRRRGEPAVQMHDRVTGQRRRVPVRGAAAQARDTLHRHAAGIGRLRSSRHDNRQRAVRLVAPGHRDRLAGLGLDRRARDRPVVAPDRRLGQVTVEPVRASANGHTQPAVLLGRDQPPRHRKGVSERGQRRGQCWGHAPVLPTFGPHSSARPTIRPPGHAGQPQPRGQHASRAGRAEPGPRRLRASCRRYRTLAQGTTVTGHRAAFTSRTASEPTSR